MTDNDFLKFFHKKIVCRRVKFVLLFGIPVNNFSNTFLIAFLGFIFFSVFALSSTAAMGGSELLEVTKGSNLFANKFYKSVSKQPGNVFFSPLSAHTILALAFQGSAGETAKSFQSALEIADQKVAAIGYNVVMNALNSVDKVALHIANKIFVMKDFPLKVAFKKAAVDLFLSEADSVNFGDSQGTAKNINQWVEQKTNSKIKDLISPADLNNLTRLVLVNAIYFKGNWANQFKTEHTKTEPFFVTPDNKVDCQMMHIKKKFNYSENDDLDAKILEMPYDNEDVSMVFILPNSVDGIKNLENKLVNVDLTTLTQNMRYVEVEVSLPKFKVETTMDLEPVLKEMGLGVIFDQNKADFSEISDSPEQLYVSKAIQKAFIEVNEEGAEAAAATGLVMGFKCAMIRLDPITFVADHPFIFLLKNQDSESINILFYGKIAQPSI